MHFLRHSIRVNNHTHQANSSNLGLTRLLGKFWIDRENHLRRRHSVAWSVYSRLSRYLYSLESLRSIHDPLTTKIPFTLGTIRSFFGRLLAAGCWPRQAKTARTWNRKTDVSAIRLCRTLDLASKELSPAQRAVQCFLIQSYLGSHRMPWEDHSFNVRVILRVSPPDESMTISPWLRLTTEANLSPHSTSTILSGVTSSSRPRVSSCRSDSMR